MTQPQNNSTPATGCTQSAPDRLRRTRKIVLPALLAISAFVITANALAGDPPSIPAAPASVTKFRHWLEVGQASWYGNKFQGHRTAAGESFDKNALTCAHRTLPLGSWLRVTNLRNRKSVLVRVNDRGPMIDSRIVDLSYAAAHAVGLAGVGRVKLEAVAANDPEMARAMLAQVQVPAIPLPIR